MKYQSLFQRIAQCLLAVALFGGGFAMAQSEPTESQIYATAKAGKLDQAQVMIQQVLIAHPKSGNAHFVRAELYARQGDFEHAREALATAEQLSPGLPHFKPEAVQALRNELAQRRSQPPSNNGVTTERSAGFSNAPVIHSAPQQAPASSSWGLPLLLAGVVIVGGYFLFRRRDPVPQQATYGGQNGLSGPQSFGGGGGGYPQYPQGGGYPQAGGTGMGGRIMGGVATGLAVGAGVLAAEAIGRNLMGNHNANAATTDNNYGNNNDYQRVDTNQDMGGDNFGANDATGWSDDGGGGSAGGGGDWDN